MILVLNPDEPNRPDLQNQKWGLLAAQGTETPLVLPRQDPHEMAEMRILSCNFF